MLTNDENLYSDARMPELSLDGIRGLKPCSVCLHNVLLDSFCTWPDHGVLNQQTEKCIATVEGYRS